MENKSFEQLLNKLKEGEVPEILIEANEFLSFRECWKKLPDRMLFVGEAGLNGQIIYRYQKKEQ